MSEDQSVSSGAFQSLFQKFLQKMVTEAPAEESEFVRMFSSHFQTDPSRLPVVTEEFAKYDHSNVQKALESYLASNARSAELIGVTSDHEYFQATLPQLVKASHAGFMGGPRPSLGPVQYVNIGLHDEEVLTCVQSGLYLIKDPNYSLVVFLRGPQEMHYDKNLHVDVMAAHRRP